MGSLVAGWHTHIGKYERNKSLTKEEIEAYWRSKKKAEVDGNMSMDSENKFQRSTSLPLTNTDSEDDNKEISSLEKFPTSNAWWSRSTSAFLNEPPVFESDGSAHRSYASGRSPPYSPRCGSGNNK